MLLPVLQLVLLWWTFALIECQGLLRGIGSSFLIAPTQHGLLLAARECDKVTRAKPSDSMILYTETKGPGGIRTHMASVQGMYLTIRSPAPAIERGEWNSTPLSWICLLAATCYGRMTN